MSKKIQDVQNLSYLDENPYFKLVCCILMQAVDDGLRKPGDEERESARRWILTDFSSFQIYCGLADLDHLIIREAAIRAFAKADLGTEKLTQKTPHKISNKKPAVVKKKKKGIGWRIYSKFSIKNESKIQ